MLLVVVMCHMCEITENKDINLAVCSVLPQVTSVFAGIITRYANRLPMSLLGPLLKHYIKHSSRIRPH